MEGGEGSRVGMAKQAEMIVLHILILIAKVPCDLLLR